jgi:hypothetical protein
MTPSARFAGIFSLVLPLFALAQETSVPAQSSDFPAEQLEPESPAMVQVNGVETLKDYATVGRLLGSVDGVRRVDVTEANGLTVIFRVIVRGGSAALDRALVDSPQLTHSAASGDRLAYDFKR